MAKEHVETYSRWSSLLVRFLIVSGNSSYKIPSFLFRHSPFTHFFSLSIFCSPPPLPFPLYRHSPPPSSFQRRRMKLEERCCKGRSRSSMRRETCCWTRLRTWGRRWSRRRLFLKGIQRWSAANRVCGLDPVRADLRTDVVTRRDDSVKVNDVSVGLNIDSGYRCEKRYRL